MAALQSELATAAAIQEKCRAQTSVVLDRCIGDVLRSCESIAAGGDVTEVVRTLKASLASAKPESSLAQATKSLHKVVGSLGKVRVAGGASTLSGCMLRLGLQTLPRASDLSDVDTPADHRGALFCGHIQCKMRHGMRSKLVERGAPHTSIPVSAWTARPTSPPAVCGQGLCQVLRRHPPFHRSSWVTCIKKDSLMWQRCWSRKPGLCRSKTCASRLWTCIGSCSRWARWRLQACRDRHAPRDRARADSLTHTRLSNAAGALLQIHEHNVQAVLDWADQNKARLEKEGQFAASFVFQVHRVAFIKTLKENGGSSACMRAAGGCVGRRMSCSRQCLNPRLRCDAQIRRMAPSIHTPQEPPTHTPPTPSFPFRAQADRQPWSTGASI